MSLPCPECIAHRLGKGKLASKMGKAASPASCPQGLEENGGFAAAFF